MLQTSAIQRGRKKTEKDKYKRFSYKHPSSLDTDTPTGLLTLYKRVRAYTVYQ